MARTPCGPITSTRSRCWVVNCAARCSSCWPGTAIVSYFLGDSMQAIIIGVILAASIGLGFVNEYRAEQAAADLHRAVHHNAVVRRDAKFIAVDVTNLVPGDVIRLSLGEAVPADVRLIERHRSGMQREHPDRGIDGLGEVARSAVPAGTELAESTDLAFMGTIVSAGEGTGVVYATGRNAEFGRIAAGLDKRQPETDFQVGLRRFSYLLLQVAIALTVLDLGQQPAVATSRSSTRCCSRWRSRSASRHSCCPPWSAPAWRPGSRQLAKPKVLVKRLVCIEDLGDIDILITDKTGTLTEGRISLVDAVDPAGAHSDVGPAAGVAGHRCRPGIRRSSAPTRSTPRCGSRRQPEQLVGRCRAPGRDAAVRPRAPCDVGAGRRQRETRAGDQGRARAGAGPMPDCRRRRRKTPLRRCSPPGAGWWPWPPGPRPS